ncbi:hypothetical protein ACFTZK_01930 [Streptomyces decoyicus]|uniref:hypothetical protein n=1 Tax=Streptomyces decoyicus TaxID=249567 RepID=UPI00363573F0
MSSLPRLPFRAAAATTETTFASAPAVRPGAATLADALFRAERSPHCLHWF